MRPYRKSRGATMPLTMIMAATGTIMAITVMTMITPIIVTAMSMAAIAQAIIATTNAMGATMITLTAMATAMVIATPIRMPTTRWGRSA